MGEITSMSHTIAAIPPSNHQSNSRPTRPPATPSNPPSVGTTTAYANQLVDCQQAAHSCSGRLGEAERLLGSCEESYQACMRANTP